MSHQYARGVRLRLTVPKAKTIHARTKLVMQITRRIHGLEAERKRLHAREAAIRKELAAQRRGLQIALQAADTVIDTPDEPTVRQTGCKHCGQDIEGSAPFPAGEWTDRGGNSHCPTPEGDAGQVHEPEPER